MFAIETGFLVTTKGSRYVAEFNGGTSTSITNLLYFDLPVSFKAKYKVNDNFNIYASLGEYLGEGLIGLSRNKTETSGKTERTTEIIEFSESLLDQLDYGLTFRAGVEIEELIVGISYDLDLINLNKLGSSGIQNRVLRFSLGYRFGWFN